MSAPRRVVGRFAPSPTGPLHFGSLVAAVASCCDARARGGSWIVRMEDVDEPRSRPGAAQDILRTLARYGFAWDGEVVVQSERTARYEAALATLVASGAAYPCTCTRRELADAPLGAGGERIYPGTCRDGLPPDRRGRSQRAWRVRVAEARIAFDDRLQGRVAQDLAAVVGDFTVKRADGLFAYQLAVVVDDAEQGVTDVVRGADLCASTPRQIHLQHLLGLPTPSYLHVPVAIDAARREALQADPCPAAARRPAAGARRGVALPRPARDGAGERRGVLGSAPSRAWNPARLPPVAMLPAPPGA